jgi:hypothetical protein
MRPEMRGTRVAVAPDMDDSIYLLVDADGTVNVRPGEDFPGIASGLDRHQTEYRFDLRTRRLTADAETSRDLAPAQHYVTEHFGNPERLMAFAKEGYLAKGVMADLLRPETRQAYLDACARVERAFTEACFSKGDPCLASGCSVESGDEICLNPIREAGVEYQRACAAEWAALFETPANRIDAWKN